MIKRFKQFEKNYGMYSDTGYEILGTTDLTGKEKPISKMSANRIQNEVKRWKRLGNTQVHFKKWAINKPDLTNIWISAGHGNFISWGQDLNIDWESPDLGKIETMSVFEYEDGWFIVYLKPLSGEFDRSPQKAYVCDQVDGVIKIMRDYGILHQETINEGYLDNYYEETTHDEHIEMSGVQGVRMGINRQEMTQKEKEEVTKILKNKVVFDFDVKKARLRQARHCWRLWRDIYGYHSIIIKSNGITYLVNKVLDGWFTVSKTWDGSFKMKNYKCDHIEGLVEFLKNEVLKSDEQ